MSGTTYGAYYLAGTVVGGVLGALGGLFGKAPKPPPPPPPPPMARKKTTPIVQLGTQDTENEEVVDAQYL